MLELVRSGGILRRGFDGIEGLNMAEALTRLANIPQPEALQLLEAAEVGLLAGIAEQRERRKTEKEG